MSIFKSECCTFTTHKFDDSMVHQYFVSLLKLFYWNILGHCVGKKVKYNFSIDNYMGDSGIHLRFLKYVGTGNLGHKKFKICDLFDIVERDKGWRKRAIYKDAKYQKMVFGRVYLLSLTEVVFMGWQRERFATTELVKADSWRRNYTYCWCNRENKLHLSDCKWFEQVAQSSITDHTVDLISPLRLLTFCLVHQGYVRHLALKNHWLSNFYW